MWTVCLLLLALPLAGQTVFNAPVSVPGGFTNGLFQMQNGNVTPVDTGLATNDFPSLSRDGRFITMAAPNPAQPAQAATDLFIYDRVTGLRRTLVDHSAETLQDGSIVRPEATYSALSPNNQLVVLTTMMNVTTNVQGTSSTPMLTVNRSSDGFQLATAAIGLGDSIDFFRSEFKGISWAPDGSVFAVPHYVNTPTPMGDLRPAVGIVVFAHNPMTTQWDIVGQITQPRIFDNVIPNVVESHVFPAISPNGQRLAYFELTWPDPLLAGPVSARLLAVNIDGSNPLVLVNFNPGFYPMGVTWSADGSQVIYSVAPQLQVPGQFFPAGDPAGAAIRAVSSTNPVAIFTVPGIDSGSYPHNPSITAPPPGPTVDLRRVPVILSRQSNGNLLLTAPGLDPDALYRLESGTTLDGFGNPQDFTGAQIMAGIDIPLFAPSLFFRFTAAP